MLHMIWYTFFHIICSKLLVILFSNDTFWKWPSFKNHFGCNCMLRYYITVSFGQFTKILNPFFFFVCLFLYLSTANQNLEISMPIWFEQLNKLKHFWGTFSGSCFDKGTLSQKCKILYLLKTKKCEHTKHLLDILYFRFLHALNFPSTWNKEASSCR